MVAGNFFGMVVSSSLEIWHKKAADSSEKPLAVYVAIYTMKFNLSDRAQPAVPHEHSCYLGAGCLALGGGDFVFLALHDTVHGHVAHRFIGPLADLVAVGEVQEEHPHPGKPAALLLLVAVEHDHQFSGSAVMPTLPRLYSMNDQHLKP